MAPASSSRSVSRDGATGPPPAIVVEQAPARCGEAEQSKRRTAEQGRLIGVLGDDPRRPVELIGAHEPSGAAGRHVEERRVASRFHHQVFRASSTAVTRSSVKMSRRSRPSSSVAPTGLPSTPVGLTDAHAGPTQFRRRSRPVVAAHRARRGRCRRDRAGSPASATFPCARRERRHPGFVATTTDVAPLGTNDRDGRVDGLGIAAVPVDEDDPDRPLRRAGELDEYRDGGLGSDRQRAGEAGVLPARRDRQSRGDDDVRADAPPADRPAPWR